MKKFTGFTNSETLTQIPDSFFQHLLNESEDAHELKVALYALWRTEHMESAFKALREADFEPEALGLEPEDVRTGIKQALKHGILLAAEYAGEVLFFVNSPRGKAAAEAFARGERKDEDWTPSAPPLERANIFRLYEENIGVLTPLIADALKDAETTYSAEWVGDALEIAVKNNKRSWKYCEAILKRWKEEGRGEKQDRRNAEKDRGRYITGEYADYIEH